MVLLGCSDSSDQPGDGPGKGQTADSTTQSGTAATDGDSQAWTVDSPVDITAQTKPDSGASESQPEDGDDPAGPEDYQTWESPQAVLVVTGNQHGYIEPCGCTGLERQKGGVARRMTFLTQLKEKGWPLIPLDAGNLIRRIGAQASIKYEQSTNALKQMEYQSVGFGPDDLRLSATDLISYTYADSPEEAMFVSANVTLLDPELLPNFKLAKQGDITVGITNVLDPKKVDANNSSDITIEAPVEAAKKALDEMNKAGAEYRVLAYFGTEEAAQEVAKEVGGYDLLVVSGGYGEPTYRPLEVEGCDTKMIVTGNKGMYAGLVALEKDAQGEVKQAAYSRVPLTHEFKDAPAMRKLMADYQQQLEQLGLDGLGLSPVPHPKGDKFVGTAVCAECHQDAFEVWESSAHAFATESIVEPSEGRGDVARHFDPECISCHVTGWNPQEYYPYQSGYLDLAQSSHLTGNGCENCHGPGAAHSAAEREGSGVSEEQLKALRLAMQLPLDKARDKCMTCHDLDNSPDFHDEGAFEDEYWPQVEH